MFMSFKSIFIYQRHERSIKQIKILNFSKKKHIQKIDSKNEPNKNMENQWESF